MVMTLRTRVKICGVTRLEDALAAADAGADAIGFVFYRRSPRYVTPEAAGQISARLPPFLACVGLFVNTQRSEVMAITDEAGLSMLQFHGDESPDDCDGYSRPFLRALAVAPGADLLQFARRFANARALLLDAPTEGYGGGGRTFDWSLVPRELAPRVVLSGGLNEKNIADAIARVRPCAVDVSSGVEQRPGIKDVVRMRRFIRAVREADDARNSLSDLS